MEDKPSDASTRLLAMLQAQMDTDIILHLHSTKHISLGME